MSTVRTKLADELDREANKAGREWAYFDLMTRAVAALRAPEADKVEVVAYQQFKDGKWVECSAFVAKGWESEISEGCRALYLHPSPAADAGIAAPPAASAEAVSAPDIPPRPAYSVDETKQYLRAAEVAALSTAPVAGADAGMRERAAKVMVTLKGFATRSDDYLHGFQDGCAAKADAIRALPLSTEAEALSSTDGKGGAV